MRLRSLLALGLLSTTLFAQTPLNMTAKRPMTFADLQAMKRVSHPQVSPSGKWVDLPDEGHWVLKPQNSQLWYDTVNDWCDRWTHTNKYAGSGARVEGSESAK